MTQHVQDLINKIKSEGIAEAENQAKAMEKAAQEKAQAIIKKAQAQAAEMIQHAQEDCEKQKVQTQSALQNAARDMILSLRNEIRKIFQVVVARDVKASLSSENLPKILEGVVQGYLKQDPSAKSVLIEVAEKDMEKLKGHFIKKLQDEIKKPVSFKTRDGIATGFVISFDEGKSLFDFSDESLSAYLSNFLNADISALLDEAVSQKA